MWGDFFPELKSRKFFTKLHQSAAPDSIRRPHVCPSVPPMREDDDDDDEDDEEARVCPALIFAWLMHHSVQFS